MFDQKDVQHVLDAYPQIITGLWIFGFGAVVNLFRSLIDGTRRAFGRMVVGSLFGGLGGVIVYPIFEGSSWQIFWTCVAAVIAENFVLGLYNASEDFRKSPWAVFEKAWNIIVPSLEKISAFLKDMRSK
jgi:hypothetical protein